MIRSYRSFSRRHAYHNTTFEVENKPSASESATLDNRKASISTKSNTSPKARANLRAKSQLSSSETQLPEKIINVKSIDGRQMLESIKETKESEAQYVFTLLITPKPCFSKACIF